MMSDASGKPVSGSCYAGRPNFRPTEHQHVKRHHYVGNMQSNLYSPMDDTSMLRHSEADCAKYGAPHPLKPDAMLYATHQPLDSMLEPICQEHGTLYPHHHHHPGFYHHHPPASGGPLREDPRELEAFAERFKQRRIKLGVTQADVGKALVHLKMPGVGTLSQSTICRFESLTLSHNNMAALKPVLHTWLEAAENQARCRKTDSGLLPADDRKRKRTSIAGPERRSLEAYFAVQQRPSGDKMAAIAEKLELKKSVVRVWFCNQRQKQKRMKYKACQA